MRDEPSEVEAIRPAGGTRLGVVGCCAAVLLIGLLPGGLLRLAPRPYYELRAESVLSAGGAAEDSKKVMDKQPTVKKAADPEKSPCLIHSPADTSALLSPQTVGQ